ncbi:MAG TPA: cytochrome c oxidase subunit II [Chloroflexota bacterium]|nr:cytochrome c oxidase subunit II [Chloroflexota bacterium]
MGSYDRLATPLRKTQTTSGPAAAPPQLCRFARSALRVAFCALRFARCALRFRPFPSARHLNSIGRLSGSILAVGLALGLLPALAAPRSPFSPASPQAASIADLFWFTLIAAGLIFLGVEGTILYSAFAHRERPGREASQFHGNTRVEIIWTALPALLLLVVFYLTVRTMHDISAPPGDPVEINVVGHQWWWEFSYPKEDVTTANELHVPVGEPILLHVTSADVIHSFWVPQLAGKQDANPGHVNDITFTVSAPGTYLGQCAEFCGIEHTWMAIRVVAEPPAQYAAWVKAQQQPASRPTSNLAILGETIFQSQTCGSCHAIAGTSANGVAGPSLTHVGSRATIGAGVLDNTPANMERWLLNPQDVKPGVLMPNSKLTPNDAKALAAYMESLR